MSRVEVTAPDGVPEIRPGADLVGELLPFVDLVDGRVDADAERDSILPVHEVVDTVLGGTGA